MSMRYTDHAEMFFLKMITGLFVSMIATMVWIGQSVMELNRNVAVVIDRVATQGESIRSIETRTHNLEVTCHR